MQEPAEQSDPTPRWRLIRLLREEPTEPLVLPVRDIRVLYGLKSQHYAFVAKGQVPHPHEYFCPMEALTAYHGHEDPALAALIGRASRGGQLHDPAGSDRRRRASTAARSPVLHIAPLPEPGRRG